MMKTSKQINDAFYQNNSMLLLIRFLNLHLCMYLLFIDEITYLTVRKSNNAVSKLSRYYT